MGENNHYDLMVLGFTFDEKSRAERFSLTESNKLLPILVNLEITKADCFQILKDNKIELPYIYKLGFPNANCIGCVKATSPTYWNLVRQHFPDVFNNRVKQSNELGVKLARVKGQRIPLSELKEGDTGRKMKTWDCGIFCEEKY